MNPHFEALKLLKEWSTALVVVQSGAMAVIGSMVKDGNVGTAKPYLAMAIICFLFSILVAANVVGAIPKIAQNLPVLVERYGDIYKMRNSFGIPLTCLALAEHLLFALGVISFAAFLCLR